MGQRILRREDDRFLRGTGQYVENLELAGALHATFVRSPYAHARIDGIDASAASALAGVAGLHRRRLGPRLVPATADPGSRPADGTAVPRRRRRSLRRRHRGGRPQRDARRGRRRRRARRRRLRPASRRRRSARRARGRRAALSRGRHQRLHEPPGGARRGAVRRLRRRRLGPPRQPAAGRVPARVAVVRRRRRRRRAADALALDADAPPGPGRTGDDPRPGARIRARRRAGRRRRLRRQAPGRRGDPRLVARAQDRAPGALDRDAQREHDRRWRTAGRRISSSPSAAAATATSRPTACGSCRTPARTLGSAPSSRGSPR